MSDTNLAKELDLVIRDVLVSKQVFLSTLLCNLEIEFDSSIKTAATNGKYIKWNPDWFLGLPPKTRTSIMFHELWHIGRLHGVRRGGRDPQLWNQACDYRINNDMLMEGHTFDGAKGLFDDSIPHEWSEEEIYQWLLDKGDPSNPEPNDLDGDLEEGDMTQGEIIEQIQAVSRAIHQTKMAAGAVPGGLEEWINTFLEPVVPWQQLLYKWFVDLGDSDYSWSRPNRRYYPDVYLPSLVPEENRLAKVNFYEDTSGSITLAQSTRFNSELKYVKDVFNPEEMNVILFDTQIQAEYQFTEYEPFEKIKVVGGGGTHLECVREHIIKTKPTAAIIFTDLECNPMQPLPFDIPVIWVVLGNPDAEIPFGTAIHIKD